MKRSGSIDPWVEAYRAGATIREIAAGAGLVESTVRAKLHRLGEPLRVRGSAVVDVNGAQVASLYRAGVSWRQIARQLGVSQTAARNALIRAGHTPGKGVGLMNAAERRRLTAVLSRVSEGRGARFDWDTLQGSRALSMMSSLIARGVHSDDIAAVVGVSSGTVKRWLRG